jgi:CHAT domain-containing protein
VLRSLPTSGLAHVAAHFTPRVGNPLFSSFELHDGSLYVHDLLHLEKTPPILVLAACRSATGVSIGDDLLGIAPSLLALGTTTVIGATTLVPDDDETLHIMGDLHDRLRAGVRPAVALAGACAASSAADDARRLLTLAAYTCFGWG